MGDEKYEGLYKTQNGTTYIYKPDLGDYSAVNDLRAEWAHDTLDFPTTKEERTAFYQQRINLIESSEGRDELRKELLDNLNESLKGEAENGDLEAPEPGGVGYGTYYNEGVLRFNDYSMLQVKIITIPQVGNDNNRWLYLTSTNRARKGVEAYVAYRGQDAPMFKVFDWSKSGHDRFALTRPYSRLTDYLTMHTAQGVEYQTLEVANITRKIGETSWVNEVMVHNTQTSTYDLVYSHEYNLDQDDEAKYLWWGPIVETFPPFPFTINNLGFFDALLLQDRPPWTLLTNAVTHLQTKHAGVKVVFERQFDSFVVHW